MNDTLDDSLDDFTVERKSLKEDIRAGDGIQICSHFKSAVIKNRLSSVNTHI